MILTKLKESTRQQHEKLEGVVDVMNRTFSLEDYKRLLTQFYRFYAAIEPTLPLEELRSNGFDAERRLKLPTLEHDLAHLGILDAVKETTRFTRIPDVSSLPAAFGCCYVMEGATLGGQIISRQLKTTLGLDAENGAAFFNSYGPNVGPMWKEFGAAITAYAETAGRDEEIVEGAKATFDSFRRCFEENLIASSGHREKVRTFENNPTQVTPAAAIS